MTAYLPQHTFRLACTLSPGQVQPYNQPTSLSGIQMGFGVDVIQQLLVSEHLALVTKEIRLQVHAGLEDGQKFTITNMIMFVCR